MTNCWRRLTGLGMRSPRDNAEQTFREPDYPQEYIEAFVRTEALGTATPSTRVLGRKDCVDLTTVARLVNKYLDESQGEEAVGQAFAINVNLIPYLYQEAGISFTLTLGWFDQMGQELCWHSEQLLGSLIRGTVQSYQPEGIPLHV